MIEPAGTQLWADVRWRDGWRLQRRWDAGANRVLDPEGRVRFRGTQSECERALDEQGLPDQPAEHLVVLLHGLGRTRRSLARLDEALLRSGFTTARLDYPSTRKTIEAHAASIAELLGQTPTPKRLSFVSHSLGGLIVRQLLACEAPWRAAISRIVMIAPPNQGASLAGTLDKGGVLRSILGPAYVQIAQGFATTLPVPEVPFSIYAGDAPGVPGDGLVAVDETHLAGMAEHHVVPALHTFLMNHPAVIDGVLSFLGSAPDHPGRP